MGSVRVVEPTEVPWIGPQTDDVRGPIVDPRGLVELPDGHASGAARYFHPGSESELQLYEVRALPGAEVAPHAHERDEIIYVLEGEMHLGARVLRRGASLYVEAMTLYGFRAGPEGLRFLNFRPQRDVSHIDRSSFLERRRSARSDS